MVRPLSQSLTQIARDVNYSFWHGKKVVATDGIKGLYQGFVISVWGIIFYRGVYFGM